MKKNNLVTTVKKMKYLFLFLLPVFAIESCNKKVDFSYQVQTRQVLMFDQLSQDTSLSILVAGLTRTKLSAVLNSYGPYTLFAPDNNAFRKYFALKGKTGLADFDDSTLSYLLRYHIMTTRLVAANFKQGPQDSTASTGDNINIDISKGYKTTAIINASALIYQTDIQFYNGYMHKIDGVLDPPTLTIGQFLANNPDKYSIFTAGLKQAGLIDTLTNLTNYFGTKIRLTLFAETNDVLKAAGINDYTNLTQDSLVRLMRDHIVPGVGPRSSYTHLTNAIPGINVISRFDSAVSTLDGQDWIYFDLAANHLIDSTNDFTASDLSMRNGLVHTVAKPLVFSGPTKKRTQIYHQFWSSTSYCYGIPGFTSVAPPVANASSGNWRYYYDGNTTNGYQTTNLLFVNPDGVNDSMVSIVRGIKRGKYRIEVSGKGGARGTFQLNCGADSITTYNFGFPGLPTYAQHYPLATYYFKQSGDIRLNFICTVVGGLNLNCLVLTPVN